MAEIRDRGGKKYLIRLGRKRLMVSRGMNYNQSHLFSLSQCHYHQLSNYSHYDYLFSRSSLSHMAASFTTYLKSTTTTDGSDIHSFSASMRQTGHALLGLLRLRSSRTTLQLKIMKKMLLMNIKTSLFKDLMAFLRQHWQLPSVHQYPQEIISSKSSFQFCSV